MSTAEAMIMLVLTALLWGFTNPLMKKGSIGIEKVQKSSAIWQFLAELKFLATNWKYMFPFLINMSGSFLYYYTLGSTDLSMAVPVTNSLTFIFTIVAGRLLGETTSGNKSTYLGIVLVMCGIILCVLDKTWNLPSKKT